MHRCMVVDQPGPGYDIKLHSALTVSVSGEIRYGPGYDFKLHPALTVSVLGQLSVVLLSKLHTGQK